MASVTVLEALNEAMAHELRNDHDVVILGEDVGTAGGIFRATQGLQQEFGPARVIDTPLDEKGIAAHAIGMAIHGMKAVAEIQFSGFIHDAFEQLMFCGAKYRWLTGGQYSCPLTVRAPSYGGIRGGFWHSQSVEAYYAHGGGMKIVAPSTPSDAYRLLLAAIRDPDPVLVIEPVPLYRALRADVEFDGLAAEIGPAAVRHSGNDVTLVAYGPLVHTAVKVAEELKTSRGIGVDVIDLCSLVPWDIDTVVGSVRRTGRMVVVSEATGTAGFTAEVATAVQERAFGSFHAPIDRVAAPDFPYPFAGGDEYYRPGEARIEAAVERVLRYEF